VLRHVPAIVVLLCASPLHAAVLERVDTVGGDTVAVRLHLSAPVAAQTQQLPPRASAPDRIVVDLPGTTLGTAARGVVSGRGPLLRVRTGQLDATTTRVVLDLEGPVAFAMTNDEGVVTITLEPPGDAPATPPTIPRVEVPSVEGAPKRGSWRMAVPARPQGQHLDYEADDIEPLPSLPRELDLPPSQAVPPADRKPYLRY
jgi:hypothetical protein